MTHSTGVNELTPTSCGAISETVQVTESSEIRLKHIQAKKVIYLRGTWGVAFI